MSEGAEELVSFVTVVIERKVEDNDAPQPVHVEVDPSKFRFLAAQLQDAAYAKPFVNTHEVIADLSEAAVGAELATDIAIMLDVSEGRTAVTSVRIAAQTLRGADYVQLLEELYLEKVVSFFLEYLRAVTVHVGRHPRSATPEVVRCVHTGQQMWDRLGAYNVLRLMQMGTISLGHKGVIDGKDKRIHEKLLALADTMNDVTSLDISGNDHITQCDSFAETLVTLVLRGCKNFTETSIQRVAKYGRLQRLNVAGASNISDASLMAVAEHCPQIEFLDFRFTKGNISDTSISLIAQRCPQLHHLSMGGNTGVITDTSISLIAQHCLQLQHLNVDNTKGGITDSSISLVARHCPLLHLLYVGRTKGRISDTSISLIAHHCPQLQYLDVSASEGVITDTSLSLVAQHCPQLRYLNVRGTEGAITDSSISLITHHCPQLQYLNACCTKGLITDTSISLIAHHCPHLRLLFVGGTMGRITDTSLSLIAEHCPQLEHLNVEDTNGRITDSSISLIAQHCPQLRFLSVGGTKGVITDTSISLVAQHCPQLAHLNIDDTHGKITDASLSSFGLQSVVILRSD